jgi:hypothetical protein
MTSTSKAPSDDLRVEGGARVPPVRRRIFWHRQLPPLTTEILGEHVIEAVSMRVKSDLAHRGELWDRCYSDLMVRAEERLDQEMARLGGDCVHVLEESVDTRRDDLTGEAWLHGRFSYLLLRDMVLQA